MQVVVLYTTIIKILKNYFLSSSFSFIIDANTKKIFGLGEGVLLVKLDLEKKAILLDNLDESNFETKYRNRDLKS